MANGVYISMSAAIAADRRLDVVANNVANVNTTGFKQTRTAFKDFLVKPGPDGLQDKGFSAMALTQTDTTQGGMQPTGNPLDVALSGPGFFVVRGPQGDMLTRNGSFRLSADGTLVNADGMQVLSSAGGAVGGPIRVDPTKGAVSIGPTGIVEQQSRGDQAGTVIATLSIMDAEQAQLSHAGGSNYSAPAAALQPVAAPDMVSGFIEKSNVNPVRGMIELIAATRDFEQATRVMNRVQQIDKRTLDVI